MTIRVTIWNEGIHERQDPGRLAHYPHGIHGAIADGLTELLGDRIRVQALTLEDPFTDELLESTDVLLWWGHEAHDAVPDELVERIHRRVLAGMGLLALHSAHFSKIFIRLMGTTCSLAWRNDGLPERVWTVAPSHPIAHGVQQGFVIDAQEMYGEFFDVPEPDELVFISSFSGGEVFRSGLCYRRGFGRVFYFSPGDQDYPVYLHPQVRQVLANAVEWAAPVGAIAGPPAVTHAV